MKSFATLDELVRLAADEDFVEADVSCRSLTAYLIAQGCDPERTVDFGIRAKEPGVFSGRPWLNAVAAHAGWTLSFARSDGEWLEAGDLACSGRAAWSRVLGFERLCLNLLQHLSGISTQTRSLVELIEAAWRAHPERGTFKAPGLFHTRKTLPLLRDEQLAAVLAGGGRAHRRDLSSRFMAKDNHKDLLTAAGLAYADWARQVAAETPQALFEVDSADEALVLADAGVRCLLLDNFSPADVAALLPLLPVDMEIEVSGGLNAASVHAYVMPGVQRLSVGALTHSVRALDLSLEVRVG
jgi:nicotinate-nucleotide pyrophosphorylase (carboxylating)